MWLAAVWLQSVATVQAENVLIPARSEWRYLANGTDPGVAWRAPAFPETGWSSGQGKLGFGNDGETTVIGNAANGFSTFYFRRPFVTWNPAAITNLTARLGRDDGAVLYLNGIEALRCNMPDGVFNHLTLASAAVSAPHETNYFHHLIDPGLLVPGTNWIAVEIHQAATDSSDLGFDLELVGNPLRHTVRAEAFIDSRSRLNFQNETVWWHHLSAAAPGRQSSSNQPTLLNEVLWYPAWPDVPNRENRDCNCTSSTTDEFEAHPPAASLLVRTRHINGRGSLRLIQLPGPENAFRSIIEMNDGAGGAAWLEGLVDFVPSQQVIPFGSEWKYLVGQATPALAWIQPGFNEEGWSSGPGQLGYGDGDEQTQVTNTGALAHYFRKTFSVTNRAQLGPLTLTVQRDDGVIAYLNGTEIMRNNMPAGAVNHTTLASTGITDDDEAILIQTNVAAQFLLEGTNVLAVEVHQVVNSSDLSFDLRLDADVVAPVISPPLSIHRTEANLTLAWPASFADYVPQATAQLPGSWATLANPVSVSNGQRLVTIQPTDSNRFYRLAR